MNVILFSMSPYLFAHLNLNYEIGRTDMCSEKKHRDVSRTTETPKMELFVTLISSFQLLTNFTKNSIVGVTGVLDSPLEYYNVF